MCTDFSADESPAPRQNCTAPSLPNLLWFREIFLKLLWSRSISPMADAAVPSMEQLSRASSRRLWNFLAAPTTVMAPSDPIWLSDRCSTSIRVGSSSLTASHPGAWSPMPSARRDLKGLNCATPSMRRLKPSSPMAKFPEMSREVTPDSSAAPPSRLPSEEFELPRRSVARWLEGEPGSEPTEERTSSELGSHVLANSLAVSTSMSFERRIRVETCRVKRGRPLRRSEWTSAEMLRWPMPFSDRSMPWHSFPRTVRLITNFFEKWLRSFIRPLYAATSGFSLLSSMLVKLSADAYHEVSRKERFLILRQAFLGSKSMPAIVSFSSDWQLTAAKISFASSSSGTDVAFRRLSSSCSSMFRWFSVVVFRRTRISSRISAGVKSQKLRFQTPRSSPVPFSAPSASVRKPWGTCFAWAPIEMSFSLSPSSSPLSFLRFSRPSSTRSAASDHFPSFRLSSAALWQAKTR
mmetsp:Transcript_76401/g.236596  ORF Transcript_76401/g.236596 Transcript_76401/m.236596 type:complete len:464 (-) Transcript_76401:488-1879(-)